MEHDLEELFTFAQNQMMGFEVVDNEESKSFYLNNEFIGGWAGDTREFFFENNDEFQFLKESYEDLLKGKAPNYSPFRPGMTATVDIITTKKQNIIGVPISAVVVKEDTTSTKKDIVAELEKEEKQNKGTYNPDQKFECVFVKVGDKAKLRVVKTGIQDDTNIEIMEGLKKGEEIITGPYLMVSKDLNTNDKVKVQSKKDDKAKK